MSTRSASKPNATTRDHHVVSQVLLRRFVDSSTRTLAAYHLPSGRERQNPTSRVCKTLDFIRHDADDHEKYWNRQVENYLHVAFKAVDDRTIFGKPRQIEVLKDCLALHWARSNSYLVVFEHCLKVATERAKQQWRDLHPDELADAFYQKYNFYPAGPEALDHINDLLYKEPDGIVDGSWFAGRVRANFEAARSRFANERLQVGEPCDGDSQFLISDAPVLSFYRAGSNGPLPYFRAPLNEAGTVVLPIGPRHMIGLGREEKWVTLGPDDVQQMNTTQVTAAKDWVIYHPSGSGLESFVEQAAASRKSDT